MTKEHFKEEQKFPPCKVVCKKRKKVIEGTNSVAKKLSTFQKLVFLIGVCAYEICKKVLVKMLLQLA